MESVTEAQLSTALMEFGITVDRQIASFPFYVVTFSVTDANGAIEAARNTDSLMGKYIDGYDINNIDQQSFQNATEGFVILHFMATTQIVAIVLIQ